MKWNDLLGRVAESTGLRRSVVDEVARSLVREAGAAVAAGEDVTFPGVGTLSSRWRSERAQRSVQDQRRIALDGAFVPRFRPSSTLRAALRDRTPQHLKDPAHQAAWRLAEALMSDLALYAGGRAPSLASDMPEADVDAACGAALGNDWRQARATYDRQVAAEVRGQRDHLAQAARRRWGAKA